MGEGEGGKGKRGEGEEGDWSCERAAKQIKARKGEGGAVWGRRDTNAGKEERGV